jgi:uncharacterized protein
MDFEWDRAKAAENEKKHNVSFEEATLAFFDEWAIEEFDDAHSDDTELRYVLIGLAQYDLLRVVYTVRDKIRIISAEKARPYDEKAYNRNRNEQDR